MGRNTDLQVQLNMTRHIVARTSEIPPGGNKVVDVAGRDVVVFHVNSIL